MLEWEPQKPKHAFTYRPQLRAAAHTLFLEGELAKPGGSFETEGTGQTPTQPHSPSPAKEASRENCAAKLPGKATTQLKNQLTNSTRRQKKIKTSAHFIQLDFHQPIHPITKTLPISFTVAKQLHNNIDKYPSKEIKWKQVWAQNSIICNININHSDYRQHKSTVPFEAYILR